MFYRVWSMVSPLLHLFGLLVPAVGGPPFPGHGDSEDYRDQQPPAVIQTLINAHINGFNTQDSDLFPGRFRRHCDHHRRHRTLSWLNANAPANWLADVEK